MLEDESLKWLPRQKLAGSWGASLKVGYDCYWPLQHNDTSLLDVVRSSLEAKGQSLPSAFASLTCSKT